MYDVLCVSSPQLTLPFCLKDLLKSKATRRTVRPPKADLGFPRVGPSGGGKKAVSVSFSQTSTTSLRLVSTSPQLRINSPFFLFPFPSSSCPPCSPARSAPLPVPSSLVLPPLRPSSPARPSPARRRSSSLRQSHRFRSVGRSPSTPRTVPRGLLARRTPLIRRSMSATSPLTRPSRVRCMPLHFRLPLPAFVCLYLY